MTYSKLLTGIIVIGTSLTMYACAPWLDGGRHSDPRGPGLSAQELFTNADVNGDNMLSLEEFASLRP